MKKSNSHHINISDVSDTRQKRNEFTTAASNSDRTHVYSTSHTFLSTDSEEDVVKRGKIAEYKNEKVSLFGKCQDTGPTIPYPYNLRSTLKIPLMCNIDVISHPISEKTSVLLSINGKVVKRDVQIRLPIIKNSPPLPNGTTDNMLIFETNYTSEVTEESPLVKMEIRRRSKAKEKEETHDSAISKVSISPNSVEKLKFIERNIAGLSREFLDYLVLQNPVQPNIPSLEMSSPAYEQITKYPSYYHTNLGPSLITETQQKYNSILNIDSDTLSSDDCEYGRTAKSPKIFFRLSKDQVDECRKEIQYILYPHVHFDPRETEQSSQKRILILTPFSKFICPVFRMMIRYIFSSAKENRTDVMKTAILKCSVFHSIQDYLPVNMEMLDSKKDVIFHYGRHNSADDFVGEIIDSEGFSVVNIDQILKGLHCFPRKSVQTLSSEELWLNSIEIFKPTEIFIFHWCYLDAVPHVRHAMKLLKHSTQRKINLKYFHIPYYFDVLPKPEYYLTLQESFEKSKSTIKKTLTSPCRNYQLISTQIGSSSSSTRLNGLTRINSVKRKMIPFRRSQTPNEDIKISLRVPSLSSPTNSEEVKVTIDQRKTKSARLSKMCVKIQQTFTPDHVKQQYENKREGSGLIMLPSSASSPLQTKTTPSLSSFEKTTNDESDQYEQKHLPIDVENEYESIVFNECESIMEKSKFPFPQTYSSRKQTSNSPYIVFDE